MVLMKQNNYHLDLEVENKQNHKIGNHLKCSKIIGDPQINL